MIYSSWDIKQNKLKLVILGHFLPFIPLKILKNKKFCWRYHSTLVHQKSQSYDVQLLRCWVRKTKNFVILGHFFLFYLSPLMIPNIKILKKMKKIPGDIILIYIHVYLKWRSYYIWFPKYKVRQTEIFDMLGHFFALSISW